MSLWKSGQTKNYTDTKYDEMTSYVDTADANIVKTANWQLNTKATSQALITTAAASGSTGIQIINDSNINFGTGDFSINIVLAVPYWTPSADVILAQKHDSTNGWILTLLTTGKLRLTINSTTYDSTTAITASNGFTANVVAAVKRSSTYRDGYVQFFQDGRQIGESVAIAQGAPVTIDNTAIAYIAGTSATTESLILSFFCTFNKTISETEAYNFYTNGLLPEHKNGTMSVRVWGQAAGQFGSETQILSLVELNGEIYGGTYPNAKLLKWNGTNAWTEVAPKFGSETYIYSLIELNGEIYGGTYPNGKLLKWNGTNAWTEVAPKFGSETDILSLCELNGEIYGGTNPNGKLLKWNGTNAWTEVAPKFGSETYIRSLCELNGEIYGGTYPNAKLLKWNGTNAWVEVAPRFGSETQILSLVELNGEIYGGTNPNGKLLCSGIGATTVLEPDKLQTKQWLDSSINKLHAMLPATGTSLKLSKNSFEIRWLNTWAGTHEAQYIGGFNQAILPENCYIENIIGVVSGTTIEDIIIGDGSDTDRWVSITTGLAAGTVSFTLANRISDGTNYKMICDPDANFTGSISWIIKGIIL
jgi:hypothetical protein